MLLSLLGRVATLVSIPTSILLLGDTLPDNMLTALGIGMSLILVAMIS